MRRLKTLFWILLQAGGHNMFKGSWRERLDGADRFRVVFQNGGRQRDLTLTREGPFSRHHLIEHSAKRKNVRAGVGFLSLDLLRRHVLDGADNAARGGQRA